MDTEILIISRNYLSNELLGFFLKEQLPNCRISCLEQLGDFQHSIDLKTERDSLFLCDCKSFSPDYYLGQLKDSSLPRSCQTRCLLYNLERDMDLEVELIKRGVQGIVFADDKPEILVNAINEVLNGQLWVSRQTLSECLRNNSEPLRGFPETLPKKLTPRESQILRLIVDGSSNGSIAVQLCISRHTVKTHLYNIFRKIDVPNRMKAARWAEKYL